MLRQVPSENRLSTTSTVHLPTKKKFTAKAANKALAPAPVSSSASTFASSLATSTEQDLEADLHFLGAELDTWVEPVVPRVIHELEEDEENMVANLRAGFKERQRKCLSKSIAVTPLLAKRSCAKDTYVEPISNAPSAPMPLVNAVGPNNAPIAKSPTRKDVCPTQDGTSIGPTHVGDNLDRKDASIPSRVPSWEEMAELLKQVPCFTEAEPLSTNMADFFLLTKRVSVDLDDNPSVNVATRLPYGTQEFIVSHIQSM